MIYGDAREGKWRGNWRMEWVDSTLHTTSEHGVSSITTADAHTSAASSRLNWRPRWFKWTRPFRRKTKYGFCACAITFQTHSTPVKPSTSRSPSCLSVFIHQIYSLRTSRGLLKASLPNLIFDSFKYVLEPSQCSLKSDCLTYHVIHCTTLCFCTHAPTSSLCFVYAEIWHPSCICLLFRSRSGRVSNLRKSNSTLCHLYYDCQKWKYDPKNNKFSCIFSNNCPIIECI
jgi:hypothetical protein